MKKTLLIAPMNSIHRMFNRVNIEVLITLGYEVHLAADFSADGVTAKKIDAFLSECADRGIRVHSIPFRRHSLLGNIGTIKPVRRLLREEKFDLVHAHTETGGLILRLAGKPYKNCRRIYTPHGMSFYRGSSLKSQLLYRPIEHWICAGMDENIAINQEEFDVLKKWNLSTARFTHGIGLDISKIQTPVRSRDAVRAEFGIPEEAFLLLSVGELNDNKNHTAVLEALGRLKRDDLYYIVCGKGDKKAVLEKQIAEKGLAGKVFLAGYRTDIADMLGASDIFVFPSYHEGLPVSLMEAMAAGTAVICSDIRGSRDLITDGENGFLFVPDDIDTLTGRIEKLTADAALRQIFIRRGKEKIDDFSGEAVYRELKEIYRDAE